MEMIIYYKYSIIPARIKYKIGDPVNFDMTFFCYLSTFNFHGNDLKQNLEFFYPHRYNGSSGAKYQQSGS